MVFDIPSLIGKNVDEMKFVLGPPTMTGIPGSGGGYGGDKEKYRYWNTENANLTIEFDNSTRRIINFIISPGTAAEKRSFADIKEPLILGNVTEDSNNYSIQSVPVVAGSGINEEPGRIWEIRISPK